MDVPIETAKQKIPTRRQTCNTKDQTVMKRNRNNTRQSVSYYRRPYKKKQNRKKLKIIAVNVYGKLYPKKNSPQTSMSRPKL